jgi:hypothetical protein
MSEIKTPRNKYPSDNKTPEQKARQRELKRKREAVNALPRVKTVKVGVKPEEEAWRKATHNLHAVIGAACDRFFKKRGMEHDVGFFTRSIWGAAKLGQTIKEREIAREEEEADSQQ